jgi:hypothetical protein
VRDAQDSLRTGITEHEAKNFKEAIAAFKKSAMIHPFDEVFMRGTQSVRERIDQYNERRWNR